MSTEKMPAESRRIIRLALMASGLLFMLAGAFVFVSPAIMKELFGMGAIIAMIFGGTFMIVGLSDLLIVRFLFSESNRK